MNKLGKKVLLVELNEVTWNLIDPFIAEGKLPTFARLKREGSWAAPTSVDLYPQLDPWITWTTLYTGQTQDKHNVFFLQQPPESIGAQRIWEICHDQGLSVGIYGSLCSWPPLQVNGYYVPDTFAQDAATYPETLRPIQELNLTYTRSVRLPSDEDGFRFKAKLGAKLVALGLRPASLARIASQLARERVRPEVKWRRAALQPFVNFDFFSRLYRRHRPAFATFHTNHVAHYMHTYWKAMQPELFPQQTTDREARVYGRAIEHGYRTADELLKRMLGLIDENTVLVIASSMGQKPYVSDPEETRPIRQLRSLDHLLNLLGFAGRARALATMSDQFNIYTDTAETCDAVLNALQSAYVDRPDQEMFHAYAVDNTITVTLNAFVKADESSRCFFPHLETKSSALYEELVYNTGCVKSGCHDEQGVLMLYGPGVRRGKQLGACNNLDIAPTLLDLLGLRAPVDMRGSVLEEAFYGRAAMAAV